MASAAIMAGGSLLGSALGGKGAKKAAKIQANAQLKSTQMNNDLARDIYGQNKATLSPFIDRGNTAGNTLSGLLAQGPYGENLSSLVPGSALNPGSFDNFKDSTNYEWRLGEGIRGVNTKFGARGALQSGAAAKGVVDYAGNAASQEYGNYINQLRDYLGYQDQWNRNERGYSTDQYNTYTNNLSNLMGSGMSGASALAGVGQNYVANTSNNNNQAAAAQGNAAMMNGFAQNNMYANMGNALGQGIGSLFAPKGGGGLSSLMGLPSGLPTLSDPFSNKTDYSIYS